MCAGVPGGGVGEGVAVGVAVGVRVGVRVGVFVGVGRDRLRVEVSDGSAQGARPRSPSEEGGYGLALVASLASRWGAGREDGLNLTWFELDLPSPGA